MRMRARCHPLLLRTKGERAAVADPDERNADKAGAGRPDLTRPDSAGRNSAAPQRAGRLAGGNDERLVMVGAGTGGRAAALKAASSSRAWIAIAVGRRTPRFAASGLRCGPEVDLRRVDQGRGAESAPALHVEERHVDERTTTWTAARHLSTTARNRIPLRNWHSSGWIRTTDLTIMSRAPPREGRAQAGIGEQEIPARRQFCGSACLPGVSARIRPGGPVVDPRRGALTQGAAPKSPGRGPPRRSGAMQEEDAGGRPDVCAL